MKKSCHIRVMVDFGGDCCPCLWEKGVTVSAGDPELSSKCSFWAFQGGKKSRCEDVESHGEGCAFRYRAWHSQINGGQGRVDRRA